MSVRTFAAVALTISLLGLTAAANDKKPADAKAPDFSGWLKYGNPVVGELVKCDDTKVTLKVLVGVYRGKRKYEDVQFMLHDAGLVRWKKLPPKTDDKGKRARYTPEEMAELRSPRGAPGYAAGPDDLKPGYVLELTMIRPKEVPLSKVAPQDLRVQYAVILAGDPSAAAKKDDEKKTDKKDEKKEKKKDTK
jgi:hypothetical protein